MPNHPEYLQENPGSFIAGWVGVTCLATWMGLLCGWIPATIFFCTRRDWLELLGTLVFGGMVGLVIGFAQSLLVHVLLPNYRRWIGASGVGWALATFLLELNAPFSRCLGSSNGPRFDSPVWIEAIHDCLADLALLLQTALAGGQLDRPADYLAEALLLYALLGVCLGLPQGLAQFWAIRAGLPGSAWLIAANLLAWVLAVTGGFYLGSDLRQTCLGVLVALLLPSLINALTLVGLGRRRKP